MTKFTYNVTILFYFRLAKLKGITSGPPSINGDAETEKPKGSKRSSKNCDNESSDKYIDYKGILLNYNVIYSLFSKEVYLTIP